MNILSIYLAAAAAADVDNTAMRFIGQIELAAEVQLGRAPRLVSREFITREACCAQVGTEGVLQMIDVISVVLVNWCGGSCLGKLVIASWEGN